MPPTSGLLWLRFVQAPSALGSGVIDTPLAPFIAANYKTLSVTIYGSLYNQYYLGGTPTMERVVIKQVNNVGVATLVYDGEIADNGSLFNVRPFVSITTRTAAAKSIAITEIRSACLFSSNHPNGPI